MRGFRRRTRLATLRLKAGQSMAISTSGSAAITAAVVSLIRRIRLRQADKHRRHPVQRDFLHREERGEAAAVHPCAPDPGEGHWNAGRLDKRLHQAGAECVP